MDVHDLFQMLSYGELSNLAISSEGSGEIVASARPKLVQYTNEALLRLYSRFVLKENDVLIQQYDHITFYHLLPRFSVNFDPSVPAEDETIRYILDLPTEKFQDEVIKVLAVYDHCGHSRPLNDDASIEGVFTPQAKLIQYPNPKGDRTFSAIYQARHPKIGSNLGENIELPEFLWGALTSYIAYKVFSHMNTEGSSAKAQEYMMMYEAVCTEAVDRDLINAAVSRTSTNFQRGGWV